MFEDKTFENILSTMLTFVNDRDPDLDIRTGSVIYTALAPIALELETAYREMDAVLEETFLETASKDYLIKHGNQLGVELNEATNGHYKAEFDVDLEVGCRFNLDKFNYIAIDKLSDPTDDYPYYTWELMCETVGEEPNDCVGDLTPINYVKDLTHAKLISVITYGEDEEETEDYRYRLLSHIMNPSIDGNLFQYMYWLSDYEGIGNYRVSQCWNGVNTVKLTILNSENTSASPEFIKEVQNYFDPPTSTINDDTTDATYPQGRGMGNGQAPIGAIVTVDTVVETPVVVNCQLTLKDGYSTPVGVQEAVESYLKSIALNKTTIGYMPISAAIYSAESVDDVISLSITVNGEESITMDASATPFIDSVNMGDNRIPVLDTDNSNWRV